MTVAVYGMGGKGVISVLANAYPTIFRKMKMNADAGNMPKATQELLKLLEINGPMYEEGNPVGVKYLLSKMGICGPQTRLPLTEPSTDLTIRIDKLASAIKK